MKKQTPILVILVMFIFLGCSNEQSTQTKDSKPKQTEVKKTPPKENPKTVTPIKKDPPKESEKESKPEGPTVSPEQIKKAKEIIKSVSEKDVAAIDAKKMFKVLCASCHGFTGNLNINGAKDLTKSTLPLEESVAQVYHGKGLMTPFKDIMKPTEIVAVSKYIEELRK